MDKYNSFKELNNVALKINIEGKEFDAEFIVKNEDLLIKVDMTNDIEFWRKSYKDFECILGSIYTDNIDVTLFECQYHSTSATGGEKIIKAVTKYYINRILLGLHNDMETNTLKSIEVMYDDIDCLTNDKPYKINSGKLCYKQNPTSYRINVDNLEIIINYTCENLMSNNSFIIKRNTYVKFINKEEVNYKQAIEIIYKFRNFLMLMLRRSLYVKKQIIIINNIEYKLFDCYSEKKNYLKDDLKENLNHRCFKIETIDNISEVYKEFLNNYDYLYPLMEIYFNLVNYNVADLTKFISVTTMLEYYSNEYDSNNALTLTKNRKPKNKNAEYVDMVKSLINNVNTIYKYNSIDIDTVSENVKDARTYYVHHVSTAKPLNYVEQMKYSYFLIDIILLNLYKTLKFKEDDYRKLTYLDYFYDKSDFL